MHLRFNIFKDHDKGSLSLDEKELTLSLDKIYHIRPAYVESVQKTASLGLDRIGVELVYFDLFGNKESVLFAMHEHEFRSLKKALGK